MQKINLPPLSEKYCEGYATKNEWLLRYFEFRAANEAKAGSSKELRDFQSSLGKNSSILADRYRGCLLGLAIGDALGTTLEFKSRVEKESHVEITGGGVFNLKKGEWTDDTSMALCLAYSLLDKKAFDPQNQMELYQKWYRDGLFSSNGRCFDIGNTTASAIKNFEKTGDVFSGPEDEYSAGNGSLMRLAPVPLFFASLPSEAIPNAGLSSKTTHGNQVAIDSCRYFSALILGALFGERKDVLLSGIYEPVKNYWNYHPLSPTLVDLLKSNFIAKKRAEIKSTGYVIDSLEAALWAFGTTDSFEEGMIRAVNLAGDADTIGAIYGQLAGAYYGESSVPYRWIKSIKAPHYFYYLADELVSFYSGMPVVR
ncbi:MAG: ADP-ribosylglycohydrolase family protein [Pseudomonadota bacterium]|nr:ADP-ribosylglycohydrolase family protein [Pseudomonadota bacterium]